MPIHRRLNAVAVLCAAAMMICALAAPAGAASSNGPPAGTDAGESFSIQSAVTVGGPWYAFAFEGVGSAGSACCSDVNYVDAGDPPWTFTTSEPAELKVADGYLKGDRFEIFDFGVSLGQTSAVAASGTCDDDPDACFADPTVSTGTFALAPGPHSITIIVTASPFDSGAAFFRIDEVSAPCDGIAVGCWSFDEPPGSTIAIDSSGNANDGTYQGGVLLGVLGVLNTAARLDGSDDLVRVPDSASLDVGGIFSLEGWIKRSSTAKTHSMMLKGGNGPQLVVMNAGAGNQVYLRKTNVTTIARSSNPVLADGAYHHVVATVNGANSARIYIDGVENTVQVGTVQTIQNTAFPLLFGSGSSTPADFDEFAVYDGVLTQAQVSARYALGGP